MTKFKVVLERTDSVTKQAEVIIEADTAKEARRIVLADLAVNSSSYDNVLEPVTEGRGGMAVTVETEQPSQHATADSVLVAETGAGKFQNSVTNGPHHLLADEPNSVGGRDSGPSPYDYLAIALGACTSMTLRLYAERKQLQLGRLRVEVRNGKVPVEHCHDCGEAIEGRTGKIDRFERVISVDGSIDPALVDKLIEIAGKCPVHRTLSAGAAIVTRIANQS
jgi:putative redox protein